MCYGVSNTPFSRKSVGLLREWETERKLNTVIKHMGASLIVRSSTTNTKTYVDDVKLQFEE